MHHIVPSPIGFLCQHIDQNNFPSNFQNKPRSPVWETPKNCLWKIRCHEFNKMIPSRKNPTLIYEWLLQNLTWNSRSRQFYFRVARINDLRCVYTYVNCRGGLWRRQLLTTWRRDRRQAAFELKKGRQTTTTTTSELAALKREINDKSGGDVAVAVWSVARERQLSSFYRTSHTFTVLQPLMYVWHCVCVRVQALPLVSSYIH